MNIRELTEYTKVIEKLGPDIIWEPFAGTPDLVNEFNSLFQRVEESMEWPKERNHEKGALLESMVRFIFQRFQMVASIERNERTTDNEIDLNIEFSEYLSPEFIKRHKCKIICECKNVKSKSIDVGQVVKLVNLCKMNTAGLGIFISIKGLGGQKWRFAEGKRKKLWLSEQIPIISFKLDELKKLTTPGYNFYTEIKRKYSLLVDEVEDDSPNVQDPDFLTHLDQTVRTLKKLGLLLDDEYTNVINRINDKYGSNL